MRMSPTATQAYVASACQGGARITFRECRTETHGTNADAALPDVMAFLRAGVGGTRPASIC